MGVRTCLVIVTLALFLMGDTPHFLVHQFIVMGSSAANLFWLKSQFQQKEVSVCYEFVLHVIVKVTNSLHET